MSRPAKHICAIIPTYNNAGTIADVVRRVYAQMDNIIVVADGPTDNTLNVLSELEMPFTLVTYPQNQGKGYALKTGFQKAREMGFSHALTIDADGQHFPEDIPALYRAHTIHPKAIIIGSRGLKQDNMPSKNTFANKFSNFWFALQTGSYLPDTQTGFRIYPLQLIHGERWMTRRYEAELTLLVFSAWANVGLVPVPIRVFYPSAELRVSHFRPAYDFTRISVLNTLLCVLAVCYGLPRRWLWSLGYYAIWMALLIFAMYPGYLFLRLRHGDTPLMHHKLHLWMQKCAAWFLNSHPSFPFVVREVEGASPICVDQPCMMIANHGSLLDILSVMAIHPKVCLMTKEWVTKHFLFGPIARSFDILPAFADIEDTIPVAQERIAQGFSVMIFPEGTRTRTGDLGRFHRGAFYMAQKCQLPIQPLLIRGTYTALNKVQIHTDLPREISVNVLPLVQPDDPLWSDDYRLQTKAFRQYFYDRLDEFAYPYHLDNNPHIPEKDTFA